MKITIESTEKIVDLFLGWSTVHARIWQGETDTGIPVHCYVTLIVPEVPKSDPDIDRKTEQFERELQRCAEPRVDVLRAIPLRMII